LEWIKIKKLKSLCLEKAQSSSMRPTAMIAVCKYHTEPRQCVNTVWPPGSSVERCDSCDHLILKI